jgi:hypothetical protein
MVRVKNHPRKVNHFTRVIRSRRDNRSRKVKYSKMSNKIQGGMFSCGRKPKSSPSEEPQDLSSSNEEDELARMAAASPPSEEPQAASSRLFARSLMRKAEENIKLMKKIFTESGSYPNPELDPSYGNIIPPTDRLSARGKFLREEGWAFGDLSDAENQLNRIASQALYSKSLTHDDRTKLLTWLDEQMRILGADAIGLQGSTCIPAAVVVGEDIVPPVLEHTIPPINSQEGLLEVDAVEVPHARSD